MERFRFPRKHLSKFLKSRKAEITFPSLYLHIPFCKKKCYYCDFYSCLLEDEKIVLRYLEELRAEYDFFKELLGSRSFETLYIGGGTPSVLSPEQVSFLFLEVLDIDFDRLCEATIEANPESITEEKLKAFREFGITRISLGIQSLNNSALKYLGRLHDAETSISAAKLIKNSGFDLNIDIIYGIPGEEFESLKKTVESVLNLNPDSISAYAFTCKSSKFRGKALKTDEEYFKEYSCICDSLKDGGYIHYEVSNWAKKGKECIHNLNYWLRQNYLGLGPSAASLLEKVRFKCSPSLEDYLEGRPFYFVEELSEEQVRIEKAYLLLRTNRGLSKDLLSETDEGKLEKFISEGLIFLKGNRIFPTEKGMFLADGLAKELIL